MYDMFNATDTGRNTARLSVRLPSSLVARVDRLARSHGMTNGEVVRTALVYWDARARLHHLDQRPYPGGDELRAEATAHLRSCEARMDQAMLIGGPDEQ